MTNEVSFTANWITQGGRPRSITALQEAVAARAKWLGETSEDATVATAINILKSLRAETSTAKRRPIVFGDRWVIDVSESQYVSSWASPPRQGPKGRRVVRAGKGGRALDRIGPARKRLVNLAGRYVPGENLHVYRLRIYNAKAVRPGAWLDCYCTAANEGAVREWAKLRIERRIGQYRGVSKRALSLAMHRLSVKGSDLSSDVSPGVRRLIESIVSVRTRGSGYSAGEFGVEVADDLPMATLALKSGPAGVDIALRRAANSSAAIINRRGALPLDERIETPFPEVQRKRRIAS